MGSLRMYRSGDDAPLRRFPDGCFIRTYCDTHDILPWAEICRAGQLLSPDGDAGAFPAVKAEFDRLIGERLGEGAPPEAAAAAAALAYEADAAAPGMSQGETLRESAELQALISAGE